MNKTAIVTGASSGIGKATAILLSRKNMNVAIVGRNQTKLEETGARIQEKGGTCLIVQADLSVQEQSSGAVEKTVSRFRRLDVLVNAAGIIGMGNVKDTSLEDWNAIMEINLNGVFRMMKWSIPHLEKTRGTIVNVSSVNGLRAFPGLVAYNVSKAGVDHLTRCASLELAGKGIRVNAVNPGVTRTELHRRSGMDENAYRSFIEHSKTTHPLGRIGEPEEVAELIAFLAGPESGWITGAVIPIDGGRAQTCLR